MDGLIFNSERVVQRSWEWAGEILGFPRMGERIYHTLGFNARTREVFFKETVSPEFPMSEFNALTHKRYREIVEQEGLEKKPGVEELLAYAVEEGCKVALATSTSRIHAEKLMEEQGLLKYFDGAVFGDMVTEGKPHPEIYQKACMKIQVPPAHALALEDSPTGIRAAAAAGMRAIVVPDLVEPSEDILELAWRRCGTLFDVLKLLKEGE
ncbi:MAG: HAD family phosphatase [Muricomes sp.]